MNEFDTIEKVQELFEKYNLNGEENNYFIAYKDYTKASGMVNGMEYPYDALLINRTEKGLAMILLVTDGVVFNFAKLEKLHLKENEYIVVNNEDIQSITIKKYALLNSSKKKITIKSNNNKTYDLYANVNEPLLPYHNESFDKFLKEFSK